MTEIRVRDAVCLLDRFPALAGVDLEIEAGESVLLSGPNGSGKTTLLRVLAGLIPLYKGDAEVLGINVQSGADALRKRVAFVGHETGLYADLTAKENLRFVARAHDVSGPDVVVALEKFGLTRQAGVLVNRLSEGQRRRLALAAASLYVAELLLLDEPYAGLDATSRASIDQFVRDVVQSGGTVVMASHDLEHARSLVTREIRLAGGRVHSNEVNASEIPALAVVGENA